MKKTIDGHRYNSDSPILGHWDNGANPDDTIYFVEELHSNNAGYFFLHCYGGAMSPYGMSRRNSSSGWGEKIRPLSSNDAIRWATDKLGADVCQQIFEKTNAGSETVKVTVLLPVELAGKIDEAVEKLDMDRSKTIRALIEKGLGKL